MKIWRALNLKSGDAILGAAFPSCFFCVLTTVDPSRKQPVVQTTAFFLPVVRHWWRSDHLVRSESWCQSDLLTIFGSFMNLLCKSTDVRIDTLQKRTCFQKRKRFWKVWRISKKPEKIPGVGTLLHWSPGLSLTFSRGSPGSNLQHGTFPPTLAWHVLSKAMISKETGLITLGVCLLLRVKGCCPLHVSKAHPIQYLLLSLWRKAYRVQIFSSPHASIRELIFLKKTKIVFGHWWDLFSEENYLALWTAGNTPKICLFHHTVTAAHAGYMVPGVAAVTLDPLHHLILGKAAPGSCTWLQGRKSLGENLADASQRILPRPTTTLPGKNHREIKHL